MWAATSICFGLGIDWWARKRNHSIPPPAVLIYHLSLLKCYSCSSCKLVAELVMNKVNRSLDPILQGIILKWLCSGVQLSILHIYCQSWDQSLYPITIWKCVYHCCVLFCWRFELLMRECRVSKTIKFMSNSKCHLCICPLLKQTSKERKQYLTCVAFLSRVFFAVTLLRGISISVCVIVLGNKIVVRLFCFVQNNKICVSWMLFGGLLINTRACFYENSPKRGLVNLSEIISKAGGVIDCGSGGERKSGRPDINIQLPIFHLSRNYQFILLKNSFSKETLHIFLFWCLSLW